MLLSTLMFRKYAYVNYLHHRKTIDKQWSLEIKPWKIILTKSLRNLILNLESSFIISFKRSRQKCAETLRRPCQKPLSNLNYLKVFLKIIESLCAAYQVLTCVELRWNQFHLDLNLFNHLYKLKPIDEKNQSWLKSGFVDIAR